MNVRGTARTQKVVIAAYSRSRENYLVIVKLPEVVVFGDLKLPEFGQRVSAASPSGFNWVAFKMEV